MPSNRDRVVTGKKILEVNRDASFPFSSEITGKMTLNCKTSEKIDNHK